MPAMDFPSSPTNGQVFGAYTYDSTKGAWRVTGVRATSVISSATPPSSPTAGNLWFNTNDGVLFTYFDDGNTSQWVEVKSNTASGSTVAARVDALEAKPNGLVQLVPSSITVSSGTASVDSSGLVTFSGAGTATVNGVFSNTYTNYRIIYDGTLSADTGIRIRMDNFTGTNYSWQWIRGYGTTVQASSEASVGTGIYFSSGDVDGISASIDVYAPNKVAKTSTTFLGFGSSGSDFVYIGSGQVSTTTQYTGFTLVPNSGTASGTLKIYGYR